MLKQWQRILADTPEDYSYDAGPMLKERTAHLDGGETSTVREAVRRPKSAEERALLQRNLSANAKWLFDPACPRGCKNGYVFVSDYPDAPYPAQRMMGHDEWCACVTREEAMEARA